MAARSLSMRGQFSPAGGAAVRSPPRAAPAGGIGSSPGGPGPPPPNPPPPPRPRPTTPPLPPPFLHPADGKGQRWAISGPLFGGWEISHVKGSPADPNRLYASQTSGWFGQVVQRSDDGGKTWHQPGTPPGEPSTTPDGMPKGESNKFVYDASPETGKPLTKHQWYDGKLRPWEFKRVWHLEPSLKDPDTVYAGVDDAALFRSSDGAKTWQELPGLRGHGTGPKWQPGAGGMCLHTILIDPKNAKRLYVAISAAGAFRSDDTGKTW